MPDPTNARLKAPDPKLAQKRRAAVRAFLGGGGDIVQPGAPSAIERAQAAYAAESGEGPSLNWLKTIVNMKPRDMRNVLVSMIKGVAANPMAAISPVPTANPAGVIANARRTTRLKAFRLAAKEFDASRMRDVNSFLGSRRSAFELGLEPPPSRLTSRVDYDAAPSKNYLDRITAGEGYPALRGDDGKIYGGKRMNVEHGDIQHRAEQRDILFTKPDAYSRGWLLDGKFVSVGDLDNIVKNPPPVRGVDISGVKSALPPEHITLEQARAAGVLGPEHPPLPTNYRFTRRGSGVDVFNK